MGEERQVYGWMSPEERQALKRWACGVKALEVGSYEGLSTLSIASTAERVIAVDTFDGRATPEVRNTEEAFHLNMKTCGFQNKVFAIKGESSQVLPNLVEGVYGFILIDANHTYDFVSEDARLARPLLAPGGTLAFHDYNGDHPDVVRAVNELLADGMYAVEQADSLVFLREGKRPEKPRIALLYPSYDGWYMHAGVIPSRRYAYEVIRGGTSIITTTFNDMLCEVLNSDQEYTYIAMLHADVVPDMYWLDTLVAELETNRLDMLSAVVPIKNDRGTTSTGLEVPGTQWAVRRLTLREIYDCFPSKYYGGADPKPFPATFRAEDVPGRQEDQGLLLNSGCWLMRWDRPWSRTLYFRQHDRIVWSTSAQKYGKESASEDWDWSRQLLARGARLGATTKVGLHHQYPQCHNRGPWGTWERDEDFFREEELIAKHEQGELENAAAA